jgi:hypothetical protein
VAVVMYPVPAPTYNGYVDQRSIAIHEQTGIEAPLDRARSVSPTGRSSGRACVASGATRGTRRPSCRTSWPPGGVLLRQKLAAAADRCSDELVEFFQGAD